MLAGLANIMIFAGMLGCVMGGFMFALTPWVTWISLAVFIGGFCVLAYSDKYLPSEKKGSGNG